MHSFDDIFVDRYDSAKAKFKAVWQAVYQPSVQPGGNAPDSGRVVYSKPGDIVETSVKNTQGLRKNFNMLIGSFCRLVIHGRHSQADRLKTIAVSETIYSKCTDILGFNCCLSVENQNNAVRQNSNNTILYSVC